MSVGLRPVWDTGGVHAPASVGNRYATGSCGVGLVEGVGAGAGPVQAASGTTTPSKIQSMIRSNLWFQCPAIMTIPICLTSLDAYVPYNDLGRGIDKLMKNVDNHSTLLYWLPSQSQCNAPQAASSSAESLGMKENDFHSLPSQKNLGFLI